MASSDRSHGAAAGQLDAVLDVGKTHSKLIVLDEEGAVVASAERANAPIDGGDYAALDAAGIADWLADGITALGPLRTRLARLITSAHGAAFASVTGDELAWPVPDYEFAGFDERAGDWPAQIDGFPNTLSPDLPRGLNAATQFDWLERHHPDVFARGTLLPWAQYWGWWFTGAAASEVSSLGCHTHLWNPGEGRFSALAHRRGWADRFAPVRPAWDVLGAIRPALARRLGLPRELRVHVGVHDSNACLARYLRSDPRMTLVTSGTWIVVMAPGAPERPLDASLDLLGNVSVRQDLVPTGRFMGGRELQHLCQGADPALADTDVLGNLLARGVLALPAFESQGGPFRERAGCVIDMNGPIALTSLSPAERATLAAMYAAQMTAWIIDRVGGRAPVIIEGPFAHNRVYAGSLAALLPRNGVLVSTDALEGTARGAWLLAHWTDPVATAPPTRVAHPMHMAELRDAHARWLQATDAVPD